MNGLKSNIGYNTGFVKSAHKHVHFFGGGYILFSTLGLTMQ